jgi:hypothetical protein
MTTRVRVPTVAVLTALLAAPGCRQAPAPVSEVVALRVASLPASPGDGAWEQAPEHVEKMIPQDLVEPRLMAPSTPEIRVRALRDGASIVFRLEWADDTQSDKPGPAMMVDACAVQIPQKLDKEPPAPQMGEKGKAVEVTYWRADWQATMDGRGDTIRDLYPNAAIDHYPFNAQSLTKGSPEQAEVAKRYAPARALGNIRSGPRTAPVEDLIAEGPGTLAPASRRASTGKGVFGKTGWSVVITRPWPAGLADGQRTSVAFAVWQGSQRESGARKMRTGWIPLLAKGNQ